MEEFDIEVTSCDEVYWASTREYTLEVEEEEHTIRHVEDSNGGEILYKSPEGWMSIYECKDIPGAKIIMDAWDEGDLDLYCE